MPMHNPMTHISAHSLKRGKNRRIDDATNGATSFSITRSGLALSLSLLVSLPLLVACDNAGSPKAPDPKRDAAVAKIEQAATDVKEATKASVEVAGAAIRDGASQAKSSAKSAADSINQDAGDAGITASVAAGLLKDPDLSALKIEVDTKLGVVSLYGSAPSQAALERASLIAKAVKGVSTVNNKLSVKTS